MDIKLNVDFKKSLKNYNKVVKALQELCTKKVIVKFKENVAYPNGMKVEEVAVYMEYGQDEFNVHYPSRPFWRTTLKQYEPQIQRRFRNNVKAVAEGKMSSQQCFDDLGKQLVAYIKKTIASGNFAPLADSTLEKRAREGKGSQPLMDTELMYNSVTHEVI